MTNSEEKEFIAEVPNLDNNKSNGENPVIINENSQIAFSLGEILNHPILNGLITAFTDLIKGESNVKEIELEKKEIELKLKIEENKSHIEEYKFISSADKRQKYFVLIFFILIILTAILNHYIPFLPNELINTMLTSLFGVILYAFINLNKLKKDK